MSHEQNIKDFFPLPETHKRSVRDTSELVLAGRAVRKILKDGFGTFKQLCEQLLDNNGADNSSEQIRLLHQINATMIEVQKGINRQWELMDIPETHIITRIASLSAFEGDSGKADNKYHYMAFITVVGNVMEAPRKFTTKSGTEMISFKVQEIETFADREYKTVFEVVTRFDEELFGRLAADVAVTVAGAFSMYQKKTEDRTFNVLKISSPQIAIH